MPRNPRRTRRSIDFKNVRAFDLSDVKTGLEEIYGPGRVRESFDGSLTAPCLHPDHDDENPSMSVSEGRDGQVLVHCHAGCDQEELFSALLEVMGVGVSRTKDENRSKSKGDDRAFNPRTECTLDAYASAKRLPREFLEDLGLRDQTLPSQGRIVRIPYSDSVVRYRTALTGENRFRWKADSKPTLYGLFRLEEMKESDFVLIVEGESCAQTAWFHGIAALGLPGASNWREERDAEHLESFGRVYVLVEPDRGGEAVMRWVARSSIRDKVEMVSLDGYDDISDLHVADPKRFKERLDSALGSAVAWHEIEDRQRKLAQAAAWELCEDLARSERILDLFREDIASTGLVGEEKIASLLYLALTSRLLDRPVSVIVKGPSSAGKSYVVQEVSRFFPDSAYYDLSAMSERAIIYWEEDLRHRTLIIYEAEALESSFFSYLMRSLLSEGQIRYVTVVPTPDGPEERVIIRPGPTGLILTTTRVTIHPENETRMLSVTITDSPTQTKQVMRSIASGTAAVDSAKWKALQEWLGAEAGARVEVPFAGKLADAIRPVAIRLRRDFKTVLTLIQAHALLHKETRERDSNGSILATLADYEEVRDLMSGPLSEALGVAASVEVVQVVDAVRYLLEQKEAGVEPAHEGVSGKVTISFSPSSVSTADVARHLELDESTAWRRVKVALRGDYLRNLETRPRVKAQLVIGDTPIGEFELLPKAEDLR